MKPARGFAIAVLFTLAGCGGSPIAVAELNTRDEPTFDLAITMPVGTVRAFQAYRHDRKNAVDAQASTSDVAAQSANLSVDASKFVIWAMRPGVAHVSLSPKEDDPIVVTVTVVADP